MMAYRHPATIALLAPLTLAGCALLLTGCKTVGPNYKAPPVPAPPSFSDKATTAIGPQPSPPTQPTVARGGPSIKTPT